MRELQAIHVNLESTRYSSIVDVDARRGRYAFDCSGMATWVLKHASPLAYQALWWQLPHRPLARDFYRRIRASPSEWVLFGWRRIPQVEDAEPGDVIAWLKPDGEVSPSSGHVAFVGTPAQAVPGAPRSYLMRVIDATSRHHAIDTRSADNRTGFGVGTILLETDDEGRAIAYGWRGLESESLRRTPIVIGRPLE